MVEEGLRGMSAGEYLTTPVLAVRYVSDGAMERPPTDEESAFVGSCSGSPSSGAGGDVEHHNAHHDQGYTDYVHRPQDLLPDQQPQEDRAYRSQPRPYGVCDPQRDVLEALGQEVEGQCVPEHRQRGRTGPPEPFGGLEARGSRDFGGDSQDQDQESGRVHLGDLRS